MKVTYIGIPGDPDFVTAFGYRFERKGAAIDVPDNHPKAMKFVNNPTFRVTGAPDGLVIAPPAVTDPLDVSYRSPGQAIRDGLTEANRAQDEKDSEAAYAPPSKPGPSYAVPVDDNGKPDPDHTGFYRQSAPLPPADNVPPPPPVG